jgi:hypothetical protein
MSIRYRNKTEEMLSVLNANTRDAGKIWENVSAQGNYDPEKKIVKDLLRLLFELIDMILIQAGYEPGFVPDNGQEEERWDAKTGTMLGKNGLRVPGR